MKKTLLLIALFYSVICISQAYSIKGTSFRKSNELLLAPKFAPKYYSSNTLIDTISVKDKNFDFKIKKFGDNFFYPYIFIERIEENSFFMSDNYFLNNKNQKVILGSKDSKEFTVTTSDKSIEKEIKQFANFFSLVNKEIEERALYSKSTFEKYGSVDKFPQEFWDENSKFEANISAKEDELLFQYTKKHPESFVAFWKLVEKFEQHGYKEIYEKTHNNLSKNIKSKNSAEVLFSAIKEAKFFSVGNQFPIPQITDLQKKSVKFQVPKAKYTLVDFWFSHCKPCREEFPKYKELYGKFNPKGFEMVGIATDKTFALPNLQKTIEEFEIPWTIYLDENSKQSDKWTIKVFPTNFLLDENGKIIKKNISQKELEVLLTQNLN